MTSGREAIVAELVGEVADSPVAPGGGAVAALTLAFAAALVIKAARASADGWEDAGGVAAQAQVLRRKAEGLPAESAAAFAAAVGLLRAGGGDEKLQIALAKAADVPLRTARLAASLAALAAETADRGNADLRPEACIACLLADASCRAGAHLVEVNLATLPGDPRLEEAALHMRAAAAARAAAGV